MQKETDYPSEMRLHDRAGRRLYINLDDRGRFIEMAERCAPRQRSLCLILLYTGCRLSEALDLRGSSVQVSAGIITFRTLKRRRPDLYREVPVPECLIEALGAGHRLDTDAPLWPDINRVTAYRWVKAVMARAGIAGAQASPKGLRHGFGIHAMHCGVQLNMLQKWMGHAAMSTTAIYANAIGAEERAIAARMWHEKDPLPKGTGQS